MSLTHTKLFTALTLAFAITACGGGSSAPGNEPIQSLTIETSVGKINGPVANITYNISNSVSHTVAVRFLYRIDIDNDGVDELLIAGFESGPSHNNSYLQTNINIFGWNQGVFQNITAKLLPNDSNIVDGVGDVVLGDFNGDGKLDIFLSAYVDVEVEAGVYVLWNKGNHFVKEKIDTVLGYQHGAAAADINNDGFTDILAVGYGKASKIYLGSATGMINNPIPEWSANGSGVAIADFLNNGTQTAFIVDRGFNPDLALVKFVFDQSRVVNLNTIYSGPTSLLQEKGHDVRAKALDFNKDGLIDVIVSTKEWYNGTVWPTNSRLQFLKNNGDGTFQDVTNQTLLKYDTNSHAPYNLVFLDINGDGHIDIFTSDSQWEGSNNSTSMIINNGNNTFTETVRHEFSKIAASWGGSSTILRGPNKGLFIAVDNPTYKSSHSLSLYEFQLKK